MATLPENNLWNTVETDALVVRQTPKYQEPCGHSHTTRYRRADMHLNVFYRRQKYAGTACRDCGLILEEKDDGYA